MLIKPIDLIAPDKKRFPFYIVGQRNNKDNSIFYIRHYAVSQVPKWPTDEVVEFTDDIWNAAIFCCKEDARKIADLCDFKCNCGQMHHTGLLIKVTESGRERENITWGRVDCSLPTYQRDWFETMFDTEIIEEK